MVAENLREKFQITEAKEDLEAINMERSNLRNQLNDLKKEVLEKNKEIDSLELQVPELQKQLDDLQRVIGNLNQEETRKRIKEFYESVNRFIDAAFEQQKKQPISESFNSLRLDMNQINLLRVLQKSIKDDLDYIENQDILSEENLDAKRKEIKGKMEKEMAEGEIAMLAFSEHNPVKTLNKILKGIETAKDQLEKAGDFSPESGWYYNLHSIPNIQRILDIPMDLVGNLVQQVNNVKRNKNSME
jgi:DNA repair exonuclease SbcCD ATPase subunit